MLFFKKVESPFLFDILGAIEMKQGGYNGQLDVLTLSQQVHEKKPYDSPPESCKPRRAQNTAHKWYYPLTYGDMKQFLFRRWNFFSKSLVYPHVCTPRWGMSENSLPHKFTGFDLYPNQRNKFTKLR